MDTLIAEEAHQVEFPPIPQAVFNRRYESWIGEESPVLDAPVDLHQGLPDHPPGPHGEMPGLAPPLDALGDPDGVPCAFEQDPGAGLHEPVVNWRVREAHSVSRSLLGVAPSIPDDEEDLPHERVIPLLDEYNFSFRGDARGCSHD